MYLEVLEEFQVISGRTRKSQGRFREILGEFPGYPGCLQGVSGALEGFRESQGVFGRFEEAVTIRVVITIRLFVMTKT